MPNTQLPIPNLESRISNLQYSFPRYLAAKKAIDDRALNQHVWDTMSRTVQPTAPDAPLRILEIGCGIGTMFGRLLERSFGPTIYSPRTGGLSDDLGVKADAQAQLSELELVHYFGIDSDYESIIHARNRFPFMPLRKNGPGIGWRAGFYDADLFSLPDKLARHSFDLLLANAFLDLVDVSRALPHLFSYLRPGGVFYFTLNFDGETTFQPEHPLAPLILPLYHRTMDERITDGHPSGDSRTGRHLFAHLKNAGAEILAAGSSDWVVFPGPDGYPGDEAYFLHHILHFFEQSLTGHPELDSEQLAGWLTTRHEQVERGELVYVAHQLDFVGKVG